MQSSQKIIQKRKIPQITLEKMEIKKKNPQIEKIN